MKLVENAKQAYRWFSVQFMVLAGAVQAAWVFIPEDLRDSIPTYLAQGLTIGLLVLGVAGRLVQQDDQQPQP